MEFFTTLYGILFRPKATLRTIIAEYNHSLLIKGVIAFSLATAISSNLSAAEFIDSFMTWIFFTSIIFLVAYVFKLSGDSYAKLLTVLAFANLPMIFLAPVRIVSEVRPVLGVFLGILTMLWSFYLSVIGISYTCHIQRRKVVLLLAIPFIAFVFLFFGSIFQLILML